MGNEGCVVRPLSPLRKIIAARMTQAKQTIPHFRVTVEIEVDALLRLRRDARERESDVTVTLNDLLIKACACALAQTPALNIQWVNGEIHEYRSADISVVTAIEGGLATPIIRDAGAKTVWQIAREVKDLTTKAAKNLLRMDQIVGGTFSISNLGKYGVDHFDAIINPPQCAILAVGAAKPRCLVSPDGQLRVANSMSTTLSVDHRVLDGVTAAIFLANLRARVEEPAGLLTASA